MTPDERAELERLRAEVAELESQVHPTAPKRKARWRTVAATLLILFGAIFIPASIVAMWTTSEITDTNRYVQTITPLADNLAIQNSVANAITNNIMKYVNVEGLTQQVFSKLGSAGILPPAITNALQSLAKPVASGIENFIRQTVSKIVHTQVFAKAWISANKIAHQSMIDALSGKPSGDVTIQQGSVSVNLAALIATVKGELVNNGFAIANKIPEVNASFVIFHSADLAKAQTIYRFLTPLTYVLPFLALLFIGFGTFLAKSRRRAIIGAGIAVAVAAGITALMLVAARTAYLTGIPGIVLDHNAAAVVFDTLFRYLKESIRNTALIGAIVALGAFLIGPASGVVAVRRWCTQGIGSMRNGVEKLGLHLGGVTKVVAPNARYIRVAAVIIAVVVFLLWNYRTPAVVTWIAFGLLVSMGVIEFFAAPGLPPRTASDEPNALASA